MVFIFYTRRICHNIPCSSVSRLRAAVYSASAKHKVAKAPSVQEENCVSSPQICHPRNIVINPLISTYPNKSLEVDSSDTSKKARRSIDEPEWRQLELDSSKLHKHCLMLSKIRLTSLVVITTMGGYALAPAPFDLYTFAMCSLGTGLVSASANAINQFFEVPFDAQMSRTKNRVLVRGHLTPAHAVTFAAFAGMTGLLLLYSEVNGTTAILGATNLALYTLIYTPMKRISIVNTWIGSVVGAIPPLMGWAGCVGDVMAPGAWIMSGILYAWQFPHFNALSWNLRPDYSRAGYRMMAVTNPDLCRKTALRYTAVLTGLCYLAPLLDVTNWWFAVASTPLNAYFLYLAWQFNRKSDSGSSRKLFRFSLVHLPALMVTMLLSKKHWFSGKSDTEAGVFGDNQPKENVLKNLTGLVT